MYICLCVFITVWNLLTGKCVENLKFKHLKPIMCVKINKTLVISSCAGGQIRIWSMETASLVRVRCVMIFSRAQKHEFLKKFIET